MYSGYIKLEDHFLPPLAPAIFATFVSKLLCRSVRPCFTLEFASISLSMTILSDSASNPRLLNLYLSPYIGASGSISSSLSSTSSSAASYSASSIPLLMPYTSSWPDFSSGISLQSVSRSSIDRSLITGLSVKSVMFLYCFLALAPRQVRNS